MDGTRHPSNGITKVERSFEWSRLESQLMTSAYERVLPMVRGIQARPLPAGHPSNLNQLNRSDRARQGYATGA